jgi:hypothetical protein
MDDSTKSKFHVGALVVVCLLTWYATLLIRGHSSPVTATLGDHFAGLTSAISGGAFGAIAFAKWLWRWRMLHPWFVDVPVVAGIWYGDVHRKYKDNQPDGAHVKVRVTIEQPTMSQVRYIQTMEDQSAEGHTEACVLYRAADGKYYLEGLYQVTKTEEHTETKGKRQIYYGAMRLQLDDPVTPNELSGSYWSEEFTRGRITLTRESTV